MGNTGSESAGAPEEAATTGGQLRIACRNLVLHYTAICSASQLRPSDAEQSAIRQLALAIVMAEEGRQPQARMQEEWKKLARTFRETYLEMEKDYKGIDGVMAAEDKSMILQAAAQLTAKKIRD